MKLRKGIILILLIASIFMFGCVQNERGKTLTEEEVKKFVLDDLNSKYPQADVREILEIRTTDSNESWQIKTRVTFNYTSPCPVRMSVYYDYPRKGFIETPPEYITKDCQVCKGVAKCILGTPEEAIIASHTLDGGEPVSKFIKDYPNAKASAKFYSEYIDPVEKRTHNNIWVVKWTTDATNYGLIVLITNDARIIGVIRATKQETI
ncbi:MAG: hypothetical protein NZ903_01790 [Candidatus Micrarchaeota archaeon]|nr:hypothetical protein [Candidatus Micrarchaeota archaeon]